MVTPASNPLADAPAAGVVQGVGVLTPSFSPLYQQIKGLILQSLQLGEWRPGEVIPSEMDLASRYKVSQGTVRKAIDELAAENLLVRKQGKGTFVSTHAEEQVQYRFLRLTPDAAPTQAERAQREFLDCQLLPAPQDVAALLNLRVGDTVIEIRRVLSFFGQPAILDDIWLPGHMFQGLTAERLTQYQGPMYRLFESDFGVRMIRAEEKLKAVLPEAESARILQVDPATPLLSVERLSMTYGDQPVELRRGLYRTEHFHYRNELS